MNENQLDLEDWEFLPEDGSPEINPDHTVNTHPPPQFAVNSEKKDLDTKLDSPRSRGLLHQIEGGFHLDIMGDTCKVVENRGNSHGNGVFSLWKWGSSGIGAFFTVGLAAASICIIIFTAGNKQVVHHQSKLQSGVHVQVEAVNPLN